MSHQSHWQFQCPADPLCSLTGLRRLEDHLDWLENHVPRKRERLAVLVSPLLPVIAIAAAWLVPQ